MRRIEAPESRFRHHQGLPDHRGGIGDHFVTLGRGRPQPHRGKRRLDELMVRALGPAQPDGREQDRVWQLRRRSVHFSICTSLRTSLATAGVTMRTILTPPHRLSLGGGPWRLCPERSEYPPTSCYFWRRWPSSTWDWGLDSHRIRSSARCSGWLQDLLPSGTCGGCCDAVAASEAPTTFSSTPA